MKDKINVKSDELVIIKVPADPKLAPTTITLDEWRKLHPKAKYKWDKS